MLTLRSGRITGGRLLKTTLKPTCSPTTFPKFAQLPAEVQFIVWSFACFEQRVIDIRVDLDRRRKSLPPHVLGYIMGITEDMYYHTKTRRPAVLSACLNSRKEALKHYATPFQGFSAVPTIYVNPACDIVIPWGHHYAFACGDGTTQVEMFMGRLKECGMKNLGILSGLTNVLGTSNEISQALEYEVVVAKKCKDFMRDYEFTRSQWHLELCGSVDFGCSGEWDPYPLCFCAGCILKSHIETVQREGKNVSRLRMMEIAVGKQW